MGRFDLLTQLDKKPVQRTPLSPVAEHTTPLSEKENVNLLANQQTSKEADQQGSLPANQQTSKEASKQTGLLPNQQTSKILKKFGSYLTEESLRGLKRLAFETDRKDYEVLQEAVNEYLERAKKQTDLLANQQRSK